MEIGKDIIIFNVKGEDIATVGFSDDAVHVKELMKENYILLTFNLNFFHAFKRGDYIIYGGNRYMIREDYQPLESGLQEYGYELKFEAKEMMFQDFIAFFSVENSDTKEITWTLTSGIKDFMNVVLKNINRYFAEEWKVSYSVGELNTSVPETEAVSISFDSTSVFDALTQIAEAFEFDWFVKENVIYMVQRFEFGDYIELAREKELADITRSNENNDEYCTRLYAFGSTRNISKNYHNDANVVEAVVQKRLRIPADKGDYIDAIPNMKRNEIVEKIKIFEEIYPKSTGTVTDVYYKQSTDDEGNTSFTYTFKEQNPAFNFHTDYIIPGESLMIHFESGKLNGRDFEVNYDNTLRYFTIVPDTSISDLAIPNETLKPENGDSYVLYGYDISFIEEGNPIVAAENELYEAAQNWLIKITEDNATYSCPTAVKHCVENDINLEVGQKVSLKSIMFKEGYKNSRIYGFKKSLYCPYNCTYLIGDTSRYSRLNQMEQKINETFKLANQQHAEAMKKATSAYKNSKSLNYLSTALSNSTQTDGGLLLSTLMQLGFMQEDNTWKGTVGLNGALKEKNDVAFWVGGDIDDATAIPPTSGAGFKGNGAGWLAMNNISWDETGELTVTGKYQSATTGERIEIDPIERSIKMFNKDNKPVIALSFDNTNNNSTANVEVSNYEDNNLMGYLRISGEKISMRDKDNYEYFGINLNNNQLQVQLDKLPTSRDEAENKCLYLDGEMLKIKTN